MVKTDVVARYGCAAAATLGFTMNLMAAEAVMVFITEAEAVC
jgi:hypothetical protein